ncbi:LysR family transcriptional regulator [Pseudoruegeria sp. HB172150]|uniref:LysR family transcriptional regulator n=1 Tax=Pseudoruegeria sp. HB172150 TaxID=2721164 RepID=UPI0015530917|nr:LysR family transcriptional regulator [Pseudoruegeria sp. HB172150]
MTLDVRSAAIVMECARTGSIGRAARALNLTQPAVTRALNRLEAEMGVPLFERTTRGVVPTIYGEAVLPHAEVIAAESGRAAEAVSQLRGAGRGVVRVGGVSSVACGFLVEAISVLRRTHPDLQFIVVEELEDALLNGLKEGDIDLAVTPDTYADDDVRVATQETFEDRVGAYIRAGHPLAGENHVTLEDAARLDWAMPPAITPVFLEWLRRFHNHGIEPRLPCVVSRSVAVVKAAVMTGDLACWLPYPLVRDEMEAGTMLQLAAPDLEWQRTFRVYKHNRRTLSPSAAQLLKALNEVRRMTRENIPRQRVE